MRLTELSYKIGLASKYRYENLIAKQSNVENLIKFVNNYSISPNEINSYLCRIGSPEINQKRKLVEIISRPEVSMPAVFENLAIVQNGETAGCAFSDEVVEESEIIVKYSGYIEREQMLAEKMLRLEKVKIPIGFDYSSANITIEARHKLNKIRPHTIGQATRIPGVSPADISVLLVLLGR
jgi:tRNA uridine 5-carboxymethylaminomethyl modification enzyme